LAAGGFGHSFGGNAALQWCRDDPRCLAAANLDEALWTEVG
jgi:predicted dienelactone hydrolase